MKKMIKFFLDLQTLVLIIQIFITIHFIYINIDLKYLMLINQEIISTLHTKR